MRYVAPHGKPDLDPYVDGNPGTGVAGSIIPAAALEVPQREMHNFIVDNGFVPTNNDLHQMTKAVRKGKVGYARDSGTVNNLVVNLDPPASTWDELDSAVLRVKVLHTNTGPCTITFNGLPPFPLRWSDNLPLASGAIMSGEIIEVIPDPEEDRVIMAIGITPARVVTQSPGGSYVAKSGDTMTGVLFAPGIQSYNGVIDSKATATSDAYVYFRDQHGIEHGRVGWDRNVDTLYLATVDGVAGQMQRGIRIKSNALYELAHMQPEAMILTQNRVFTTDKMTKTDTVLGVQLDVNSAAVANYITQNYPQIGNPAGTWVAFFDSTQYLHNDHQGTPVEFGQKCIGCSVVGQQLPGKPSPNEPNWWIVTLNPALPNTNYTVFMCLRLPHMTTDNTVFVNPPVFGFEITTFGAQNRSATGFRIPKRGGAYNHTYDLNWFLVLKHPD